MDNPNLVYNTIGKENVELQSLCCFVLLARKEIQNQMLDMLAFFFVP